MVRSGLESRTARLKTLSLRKFRSFRLKESITFFQSVDKEKELSFPPVRASHLTLSCREGIEFMTRAKQ